MTRPLIIVGVGGVGRALCAFAKEMSAVSPCWDFIGFVDDGPEVQGQEIAGAPVLGPIACLDGVDADVLLGLGNPVVRREIVSRLRKLNGPTFPCLIHPRAYVAAEVPLGTGTVVYPGAVLDPDTRVGAFALINQAATIGHDTVLCDFATLAPGSNIGGGVTIGEGAEIGIGASCKQGVKLGAWCRVGAGAAVINDVPEGATVVGVPAGPIRRSR